MDILNQKPGKLPRYRIARIDDTNPDGLCPCKTPGCLCDVHVDTPEPVRPLEGLTYGWMALKEIGAEHVSERNIVEFARVLFGAVEFMAQRRAADTDEAAAYRRRDAGYAAKARAKMRGNDKDTPWGKLSKDVRTILNDGAKHGIDWEDVQYCLPELDTDSYRYVRAYYKGLRSKFAKLSERSSPSERQRG